MMEPPTSRAFVFDTGPLFDFLTLSLADEEIASRDKILYKNSLSPFLKDHPEHHSEFLEFVRNLSEIAVTSHVVGEIQSRQRLKDELMRRFWKVAINFFAKHRVTEVFVSVSRVAESSAYIEIIKKIGITDAGIISLAERERLPILTSDNTLLSLANSRTVICETPETVLQS